MPNVTFYGKTIGPKEQACIKLPVTMLASGLPLSIHVHVVNGAKPGPKILLTALSHGDATTGFEVIRTVLETVDRDALNGTIIAVPCQNPVGFEWGTRNTPIDNYNMNRSYPGTPKGWFTEQLTAAISPLCQEADCLIDWHGGGYGSCINYVLLKHAADPELDKMVMEYGLAYGAEYLYDGKPAGPAANYTGTLTDYMLDCCGKPAVVAECGSGMPLPFDQVAMSVQSTFNVMKKMGMLPGEPVLPEKQYLFKTRPLLRPQNGGMFYPEFGPDYLNKIVSKGTVIARVRNPLTLEVIEEIVAPCEETVFLSMRAYMTKVFPGDYAYILGERKTAVVFNNAAGK